jgi:hypothetical protein
MNWFEGFRRLKKVLTIVFILIIIGFYWDRFFSEPSLKAERAKGGETGFVISETNQSFIQNDLALYFEPLETAEKNQWIVEWRFTKFIFPENASLKVIKKLFKEKEETNLFSVLKATILSIFATVISIEILFRVPTYIIRGFKKA